MAGGTKIEWTDETWNPVTGCAVLSPGCTNCYAMRLAGGRLKHHPSRQGLIDDSKAGPVWNGRVRLNENWLNQPLRWRRPRLIFTCAHGDLFHEAVPLEWIDRVWRVMVEAHRKHGHIFQVLTKRPERMREALGPAGIGWYAGHGAVPSPEPGIWLGVSVEDQKRADERIPVLLDTPAAVRFISAEPLLGPLWLDGFISDEPEVARLAAVAPGTPGCFNALTGEFWPALGDFEAEFRGRLEGLPSIDWVICGGESGPGARPMHPDWARGIRDQCRDAEVPFFFKQWGSWREALDIGTGLSSTARHRYFGGSSFPSQAGKEGEIFVNIGKQRAGRLLDGVEHNALPRGLPELSVR